MIDDRADCGLQCFLKERDDLVALARSVVGHTDIAEDIVQDSWIRWSCKSYPARDAIPIFRRIVANLAKDWYRRRRTEQRGLATEGLLQDDALDAERVYMARQELALVVAILRELPDRTLIAFRMHRLDGKTYAEIGLHLGVGTTRVHQMVHKALVHVAIRRNEMT